MRPLGTGIGYAEHVCFCGPCSKRVVELEAKLSAAHEDHHKTLDAAEKAADHIDEQTNAIIVATAEIERLQEELSLFASSLQSVIIERDDLDARITDVKMEIGRQRDRAIQVIVNMQDYLRANGRDFVVAREFIAEARANGWAGLNELPKPAGRI